MVRRGGGRGGGGREKGWGLERGGYNLYFKGTVSMLTVLAGIVIVIVGGGGGMWGLGKKG